MTEGGSELDAVRDALGQELNRIHIQSYGRGAKKAKVTILDDLVVCLLDELELMPNEEFLVDAGQGLAVIEVRHRFQQAIETTFRAAVERATGRRVVSFISQTRLDPNYSVEIFRLGEPVASTLEEPEASSP